MFVGKSHLSLTSNSISGVDITTLALPSKRVAVPNRDGYMTESNTRQVQIRHVVMSTPEILFDVKLR
jgi:hypothetical protein